MNLGKNEKGWMDLFEKHNIVEKINTDGVFNISATTIKDDSGREPRLMAKFEHIKNLPKPLKDKNISILPTTRGDYVLGRFKNYQPLDYSKPNESYEIKIPKELSSLKSQKNYLL